MADFVSRRFGKNVWMTSHARESMRKREVDAATLEKVIEQGEVRLRDEVNLWIYKVVEGRADNMICAAVVEHEAMVVKTVMINWELEDEG